MSQLKAKQLRLPNAGDLLIGGSGGTGTTLTAGAGNNDRILRVVGGSPSWSVNDNLKSPDTFNRVTAVDNVGVVVAVENSTGDGHTALATFSSASPGDENFEFSSEAGVLNITALGTAADIDIVIAPKGGGDVVIGSGAGGLIAADTGEDLTLRGGDGDGNLFLFHGGTGRVFYGENSLDPLLEVATLGDIQDSVDFATTPQFRTQWTGAGPFVLNLSAGKTAVVPASIIINVNGSILSSDLYVYNPTGRTVIFQNLPYALDGEDTVIATYELASA